MSVVIGTLIFGIISLFLYWCYGIYKKNKLLSHIPGPLPIPFTGISTFPRNIYEIRDFFDKLTKKYGRTFKYYMGSTLTVATCDADLIQAILQSSVHIEKSTLYDLGRPWLKDGLLVSKAKKWRQRRKLINPTFHVSLLKENFTVFNEVADVLIKKLHKGAENKNTIDALEYLSKFSLDVIGETTFGIKLKIQEGFNKKYIKATNTMLEIMHIRNFSLWKRIDLLFKLFAKEYSQQTEALNIIDSTAMQIIQDKRKEYNSKNIDQESENVRNKKRSILIETLLMHPDLSNNDIHEELNNFLFAGYETTSNLLSFTLVELSLHPDIQERLYQEISVNLNNNVSNLTLEKLQKMNYLDQIFKEMQRFRSTATVEERRINQDAKFGDTLYPSGTVFQILIYWLHNNSYYYPDPEKFDPERFTAEAQSKRHPFAFVPFSAGPRNCIGQKYAILEVKTVLCRILMEFKILPVNTTKMEIVISGTLKSKYGFPIKLEKRI